MTAELHDGGRYENDLCLRVTFRDGRIASIFEYYGERAHEDLLRRLGLGAEDDGHHPRRRRLRQPRHAGDRPDRHRRRRHRGALHAERDARAPGGALSVAHRNPGCTERFEVLEGELTVQLDGQTRPLDRR